MSDFIWSGACSGVLALTIDTCRSTVEFLPFMGMDHSHSRRPYCNRNEVTNRKNTDGRLDNNRKITGVWRGLNHQYLQHTSVHTTEHLTCQLKRLNLHRRQRLSNDLEQLRLMKGLIQPIHPSHLTELLRYVIFHTTTAYNDGQFR